MELEKIFKCLANAMNVLDPLKNYAEWKGLEEIYLFLIECYRKDNGVSTIVIKFDKPSEDKLSTKQNED